MIFTEFDHCVKFTVSALHLRTTEEILGCESQICMFLKSLFDSSWLMSFFLGSLILVMHSTGKYIFQHGHFGLRYLMNKCIMARQSKLIDSVDQVIVIVFYFCFVGITKLLMAFSCDVLASMPAVSSMWRNLSAFVMGNHLCATCFLGQEIL